MFIYGGLRQTLYKSGSVWFSVLYAVVNVINVRWSR